jgi:hypothetical protein
VIVPARATPQVPGESTEDFLKAVPLFAALSRDEVIALARQASTTIRDARARAMLERVFPGRIEDLKLGFFCVTVDLIAARPVYTARACWPRPSGRA